MTINAFRFTIGQDQMMDENNPAVKAVFIPSLLIEIRENGVAYKTEQPTPSKEVAAALQNYYTLCQQNAIPMNSEREALIAQQAKESVAVPSSLARVIKRLVERPGNEELITILAQDFFKNIQ